MAIVNKYNYMYKFGLKLKPTTTAILDYVVKFANENGVAYPGQEYIAKRFNITRQTVAKHLNSIAEIKINDLPFMIIKKNRYADGKYYHNTYFFPWLLTPEYYFRRHLGGIFKELQKQYYEIVIQEDFQNHHVNKNDNIIKRENYYLSISEISEITNKLSTSLDLKKSEVLKTLTNIGYEIEVNKITIFNLDKYLLKSFNKAKITHNVEEMIVKFYKSFFEHNPNLIFSTDWEGLAMAI